MHFAIAFSDCGTHTVIAQDLSPVYRMPDYRASNIFLVFIISMQSPVKPKIGRFCDRSPYSFLSKVDLSNSILIHKPIIASLISWLRMLFAVLV
jgi:hypothetical protein